VFPKAERERWVGEKDENSMAKRTSGTAPLSVFA
jgi:hypothetical protein